MAYQVRKNAQGLINNFNKFNAPPGALSVADNVVINADDQIERRSGYDKCSSGLPGGLPNKLMIHNGSLYVNINSSIYYKDSNCNYSIVRGLSPLFLSPRGLWIDTNNENIYIPDFDTIRRINFTSNTVTTFAGTANIPGSADGVGIAARFDSPIGLWGNATHLYVCDTINSTIRKIDLATANVTTFAGTAGVSGSADGIGAAARFHLPYTIWGNATHLYVCDTINSTIRKIDLATADVTTFAGLAGVTGGANGIGAAARFDDPIGLWGNATHLYVCDSTSSIIRKIEIATANVTTFAGTFGVSGSADGIGAAARFKDPKGVWGDSTYLYVSDSANYTIRKIDLATANVTTFAGTARAIGSADGVGAAARFASPYGSWGDSTYLYVCDADNSTIRKIDLATADVTTFAGTAGVTGSTDGSIYSVINGPN